MFNTYKNINTFYFISYDIGTYIIIYVKWKCNKIILPIVNIMCYYLLIGIT